nr:trans-Golgi network integral membrane protein 1-like isoform X1 [Osmia lignaria]
MGKRIARSFYELGVLIYFLFFTKVLSEASKSTTENIINVMKNDTELCTLPPFVYENDIIKDCSSLNYPDKNITSNNPNTFLCLAFYDTWHKVCNSNTSHQIPSDSIKFKPYIEKFLPTKGHETMFCENIKSVTFTYKKLKPLLSPIHIDKSNVCDSTCFDIKENFNPLCVVLAWSKSIDEYIKNVNKPKQTQLQHLPTNIGVSESKNINSELNKTPEKTATKGVDIQQKKQSSMKPSLPNLVHTLPQMNAKDKFSTKSESVDNKKNVFENRVSEKSEKPPEKSEKAPEKSAKAPEKLEKAPEDPDKTLKNLDKAPENPDQTPENPNKPPENVDKISENADKTLENQDKTPEIPDDMNDIEENKKDITDIKTSTISENTQDHDNSVNQYDPNDGPFRLLDTAVDQNQNIPEPSEQRDIISHYHSRRSDEESHFFTYFTLVFLISIAAYIGYHNKQKILAIVLEGRRSRNNRGRRRPSTANYRKLDCTLEEAVTSQCNANVTHVIY